MSQNQKIKIIKTLSAEAGVAVGDIFDEFYDGKLRNAYILTDKEFRVRNGTGAFRAYSIPLEKLNETITKAKLFVSTIFALDRLDREIWGVKRQKAIPYDPVYKGLIEILSDDEKLMCGFKVHWPNNSESIYRRTKDGVDMLNCMLDMKNYRVEFMVGFYAREPDEFSPLVEKNGDPVYTPIEGTGEIPAWNS